MIPTDSPARRPSHRAASIDEESARGVAGNDAPEPSSPPPPAQRRASAGMLAALATIRQARTAEQGVPATLDLQQKNVVHRIASNLPPGGKEGSRLSTMNRAMHLQWRDRALADKLLVELTRVPEAEAYQAPYLQRIIQTSEQLPPALQYHVLEGIPAKVRELLPYLSSIGQMAPVLQRTLTASWRLAINHRFAIMSRISTAIDHPAFHSAWLRSLEADRTAMESMASQFHAELHVLQKSEGEDYAHFLLGQIQTTHTAGTRRDTGSDAGDVTRSQARQGSADLDVLRECISAHCVNLHAGGLYLISNAEDRTRRWHALLDQTAEVDPRHQCDTLPDLFAHIRDLSSDTHRANALDCGLSLIDAWPPAMQVDGLQEACKVLPYIQTAEREQALFTRLRQCAFMAPSEQMGMSMHLIATQIFKRPDEERGPLFTRTLQQVCALPAEDQLPALEGLAEQIQSLPVTHNCAAYDAVLTAIKALPEAMQPDAAANLFRDGLAVSDPIERHMRFFEAIEFAGTHPADRCACMVEALSNDLRSYDDNAFKLQCLDAQLTLARTLPLEEQLANLDTVYQFYSDAQDTIFESCFSRRLLDEIAMLPQARRSEQMGNAACHALQIDEPARGPALRLVMHRMQRMPEPLQSQTSEAITARFDAIIRDVCVPHAAPLTRKNFSALLNAAERCPDTLRLHLLKNIKRALPDLMIDDQMRESILRELTEKINALPIPLLARWTESPL